MPNWSSNWVQEKSRWVPKGVKQSPNCDHKFEPRRAQKSIKLGPQISPKQGLNTRFWRPKLVADFSPVGPKTGPNQVQFGSQLGPNHGQSGGLIMMQEVCLKTEYNSMWILVSFGIRMGSFLKLAGNLILELVKDEYC